MGSRGSRAGGAAKVFFGSGNVHSVTSASAVRGYRLILASLLRRKGAVAGSQVSWEQDQLVWWAAIIRVSLAKRPSSPGFPGEALKGGGGTWVDVMSPSTGHGPHLPLLGAKEMLQGGDLQEAASFGSEHMVCMREATHKPHPDALCRTAAAHGCCIPPHALPFSAFI